MGNLQIGIELVVQTTEYMDGGSVDFSFIGKRRCSSYHTLSKRSTKPRTNNADLYHIPVPPQTSCFWFIGLTLSGPSRRTSGSSSCQTEWFVWRVTHCLSVMSDAPRKCC